MNIICGKLSSLSLMLVPPEALAQGDSQGSPSSPTILSVQTTAHDPQDRTPHECRYHCWQGLET